jgi:thiol-disulfide isomerase/thioredoxin
MKKMLIALLSMVAGISMLYGAPENWLTNYDAAMKQAAKEKKSVLVLFTGSDWCPGCIALNKHTLSNEKFLSFAKENLIMVYMDSPRRTPQSAEMRAEVIKLYRKLDPGQYIPATVIVANDGRILGRIQGFRNVDEYIKEIRELIK